jgi:hypothetical protein
MRPDSDWTQERTAMLVQFRSEGMKRGAIADEINKRTGSKFTRAAICGKIDRMYPVAKPIKSEEAKAETKRLRLERNARTKREKRAAERAARGETPKTRQQRRAPAAPILAIVEVRPEDFPEARVVGIDALQPHHCRFICNDDMATPVYCGLPILSNSSRFSFCAGHHARCTEKPLKTWGAVNAA